jgi:hypothetical protein
MQQNVVSLGGNCMVTQEIRRHFGIEAANLFDWWITPGDALVRLVEADFEDLFDAKHLDFVGDRQSVANFRYGILHHHDFARDENGRVISISEDQIEGNCRKFAHLKRRWDDLGENSGPLLFVRYGWNLPAPLLEGIPPQPLGADALRLVAALDRKFPKLDYRVLLVDAPEVSVRHPKILVRDSRIFTQSGECLRAEDLKWQDNAAIFSRLFSTVKVR